MKQQRRRPQCLQWGHRCRWPARQAEEQRAPGPWCCPQVLVELMGQPLHLKVLAAYRHRRLHKREVEGTCIAQMTCLLELVLERQQGQVGWLGSQRCRWAREQGLQLLVLVAGEEEWDHRLLHPEEESGQQRHQHPQLEEVYPGQETRRLGLELGQLRWPVRQQSSPLSLVSRSRQSHQRWPETSR